MSIEAEIETTEDVTAPETEPVVEQEVAVESPTDDSDFLAGFNGVVNEEETPPEPEPEPEPEPAKLIAGYTEDQIRELLAKAQEVDRLKEREAKVFGTLGSLKQSIEALRTQQPTASVAFAKEKFKRLSAEFPEMAEMLAEDLSGMALPQQGGFDAGAVENIINERIVKVERDQAVKLLSVVHKDWRNVVQEPEFQSWKEGLAPEAREVLDNGWDAELISEGLTAFKEWKSKTAQTAESKRKRLEQAIAPKTASRVAPVQTAEDAFNAGFKSVRGVK